MDKYTPGERMIAEFLKENNIRFVYEQPLLIKQKYPNGKEYWRMWYPDFWLPKYSIVIEFLGRKGNKEYDKLIKAKKKAYKENDIDCIPVYPRSLDKNYQRYLLFTISRMINDKVRHFKSRNR
jgi:hypothetical protein